MGCNQCAASWINGVFCHEHGCPNNGARLRDGEWVKFRTCGSCGYDLPADQACSCDEAVEEEEDLEYDDYQD